MRHILDKLRRAGASLVAALARAQEAGGRIFLSAREKARRASGRFEALKHEEMEAERLDRLRHPSKYQGR